MTEEWTDWGDDIVFLPLDPAEADRQRIQHNAVGAVITWDNIVATYKRMWHTQLQPTDPRSWTPYIDRTDPEQVRAAHAALDAYEEHMTRQRTRRTLKLDGAEPWADAIVGYLRHLELDAAGIPPIGPRTQQRHPIARIHWTPRAYAGLHGLTGDAADMFVEMAETLARDHD